MASLLSFHRVVWSGLFSVGVLLADDPLSIPSAHRRVNLQGAAMWAHDLEKRQHIVAQQKGLKLD